MRHQMSRLLLLKDFKGGNLVNWVLGTDIVAFPFLPLKKILFEAGEQLFPWLSLCLYSINCKIVLIKYILLFKFLLLDYSEFDIIKI